MTNYENNPQTIETFDDFDGKIYDEDGNLMFDATDPECLAAYGIE